MTEEEFEIAWKLADKEINDEIDRTGKIPNDISYYTIMYEKIFRESAHFEYELSDNTKVNMLAYCLQKAKPMSELGEHKLLKLQYEYQFNQSAELAGDWCSPIDSDGEEIATLRECLRTGKPYELPQDVIDDFKNGFLF